jgi:hypothetical protein
MDTLFRMRRPRNVIPDLIRDPFLHWLVSDLKVRPA